MPRCRERSKTRGSRGGGPLRPAGGRADVARWVRAEPAGATWDAHGAELGGLGVVEGIDVDGKAEVTGVGVVTKDLGELI